MQKMATAGNTVAAYAKKQAHDLLTQDILPALGSDFDAKFRQDLATITRHAMTVLVAAVSQPNVGAAHVTAAISTFVRTVMDYIFMNAPPGSMTITKKEMAGFVPTYVTQAAVDRYFAPAPAHLMLAPHKSSTAVMVGGALGLVLGVIILVVVIRRHRGYY